MTLILFLTLYLDLSARLDSIWAMFYFLALNSVPCISGNDISVYPVTGIGFVLRDFSKVFSHTFRLDIWLNLRVVIKWAMFYFLALNLRSGHFR